jgi:hypothetical protein
MEDAVIGLDDLVKQIGEHLAETDATYLAVFADKIGASFANELLTLTYKYDGEAL